MDLDEFEQANGTAGTACRWAQDLAVLTDVQRAKLDAAMAAPHIQHAAIVRVLETWGVVAGRSTVARHRAGECKACRD